MRQHRFKISRLVQAAVTALFLAVAGIAAPAIAAAGTTASATQTAPLVGYVVAGHTLRSGSVPLTVSAEALNPYASGTVTVRVVAGSALPHGPHYASSVLIVSGGSLSPEVNKPDSASGCTPALSAYSTCIDVTGSGLTISQWETDAYYTGVNNSCDAEFIAAGEVYEEDYWGCGNGPGRYEDYAASVPVSFPNGTQVCNYWPGAVGGKPCETVSS